MAKGKSKLSIGQMVKKRIEGGNWFHYINPSLGYCMMMISRPTLDRLKKAAEKDGLDALDVAANICIIHRDKILPAYGPPPNLAQNEWLMPKLGMAIHYCVVGDRIYVDEKPFYPYD